MNEVAIMGFEKLISSEYEKVDKFITKCGRYFCYLFTIVWLLNIVGIFIISQSAMTLCTVLTYVLMMSPTIIFRVLKNHKDFARFLVCMVITMEIGMLYAILTYHIVLMFMFPVTLFSMYGSKRVNNYATILTPIIMTISHFISFYTGITPNDPLESMYAIMVYGLIPRLIEFVVFAAVLRKIAYRNNSMMNVIYKYSCDMYETQEEIVRAFAEICESKSGQTGSHVKRVSAYIDVMADNLGIEEQEKQSLVIASMMHDIGKLMVPSEIIEKPGKLTPDEFEEIKKHTIHGYHLLEHSPGRVMEIAKGIALEHHERWDGKGYYGIVGENIDYYSRIVSIVDVFDELISKRSYKEKWEVGKAYDEIVSQAGKQFDPKLIEVFKDCFEEFVKISKLMPD